MTVGKKLVVSGVGCQVSAYPPAKAKAGLIEDENFFVIQALAKEVVEAVSNRDELGWADSYNRGYKPLPPTISFSQKK